MSSVRQIIYLLFIIAILAATGLAISKLITENNHYIAPTEETFIVPDITPGEIKEISWETTEKLLSNCQIKVIFQTRNLKVTLRDKNDQIYQTTEPKFNAISELTKKYQGPCDIVQTITE